MLCVYKAHRIVAVPPHDSAASDVVTSEGNKGMEARNPPESFAGWRAEIGTRKWRYGREQFRKRQGSLVTEGELRSASTCAVSTGILPMGNLDSHAGEAEWRCDEPLQGGFFCFVFPTDAQPADSWPRGAATKTGRHFRSCFDHAIVLGPHRLRSLMTRPSSSQPPEQSLR